MKFVHIADMHFDSPFVKLSDKDILGDLRRLEQRKVFKKIIEYIKNNNIKYFFISGDLYEHKYVRQSTIEYINKLFKEIPETKIFIAPGNHDPYLKNSYYNKFNWNENVKIFNSEIEKIELPEADIYGFGFDDFYCNNSNIENIEQYIKNYDEDKTEENLVFHEKQDMEAMQKEYMLLGLRKIDGVSIQEFKIKFVANPVFLYHSELEKLVNEELLEIDGDMIKLTNKGLDLANIVWEEFV